MIAITRMAPPPHLTANQVVWTTELCDERRSYYLALAAYQSNSALPKPKKPTAKSERYGHESIKTALTTMFFDKCCYCESEVEHVSPRHVEHFRPASIYPALAYQWSNLLYACFRCNSTHKSDKFPLTTGQEPTENPLQPCNHDASDSGLLLNPCIEDPLLFLTFEKGYVVTTHPRGVVTREICGLNRLSLIRQRRKHLVTVELILEAYLEAQRIGDLQRTQKYGRGLRALCEDDALYAGMVRVELGRHKIDWTKLPVADAI